MDLAWRLFYRLAYLTLRAWWWLRRPSATGVMIAVWRGERLLLVRTSYRPELDLPGGGLDRGEDPAAGAARELHEETGIVAPADAVVRVPDISYRRHGRRVRNLVFEWRAADVPEPRVDRREIVWAGFVVAEAVPVRARGPTLARYLARGGAGQGRAVPSSPEAGTTVPADATEP